MQRPPRSPTPEFVSDRTPRPLMAPLLTFNLAREIDGLRAEVEYQNGHNARTLIKHSEFRLVLIAFQAGARIRQQTDQRIALQPLSGHMRLELPSEVVNLHPDQLLSLDRDQSHVIEAVEDSACLLWIGWSKE